MAADKAINGPECYSLLVVNEDVRSFVSFYGLVFIVPARTFNLSQFPTPIATT